MSVAADRTGGERERHPRLRGFVEQADAALANGRLPAALVALVCGLMVWAFLFTNDYRIETVTIQGLRYGEAEAVEDRARLIDAPTFEVEPEAIAERIAALPNVERVSVEIQFPNRASIAIVERSPVMHIVTGNESMLVSIDGFAIASGTVDGLPALELDGAGDADVDLDPDVVSAVVAVAAVYGPDVELIWEADVGLVMEHSNGGLVVFGEPVDIEAKLTVLAAIESQLEDGWAQLDIRVPTRPSYR